MHCLGLESDGWGKMTSPLTALMHSYHPEAVPVPPPLPGIYCSHVTGFLNYSDFSLCIIHLSVPSSGNSMESISILYPTQVTPIIHHAFVFTAPAHSTPLIPYYTCTTQDHLCVCSCMHRYIYVFRFVYTCVHVWRPGRASAVIP